MNSNTIAFTHNLAMIDISVITVSKTRQYHKNVHLLAVYQYSKM